MPNNDLAVRELRNAVDELTRRSSDLEKQIRDIKASPLPYPPGVPSAAVQNIISDEYLTEKIFDLTWKNMVHYLTFFESLDGWGALLDGAITVPVVFPLIPFAPGVGIDDAFVYLTPNSVIGSTVSIDKYPVVQGLTTWENKQYFRGAVGFLNPATFGKIVPTNSVAYALCGNNTATLGAVPLQYFGFKIINGVYYGVVSNNGQANEILTPALYTITEGNKNFIPQFEARWFPLGIVSFFVNYSVSNQSPNAVLPYTIPPSTETNKGKDYHLFWYSFKTTDATAKTMMTSFAEFAQKRNVLK